MGAEAVREGAGEGRGEWIMKAMVRLGQGVRRGAVLWGGGLLLSEPRGHGSALVISMGADPGSSLSLQVWVSVGHVTGSVSVPALRSLLVSVSVHMPWTYALCVTQALCFQRWSVAVCRHGSVCPVCGSVISGPSVCVCVSACPSAH